MQRMPAPVRRGDESVAADHFHRADEGLGGMFDDLFEPAGIAAVATALDRYPHPVAMHHAGHLRRREEHCVLLPFDPYEAEARAIGAHDAFGGVRHRGAGAGRLTHWLRSLITRAARVSFAVVAFHGGAILRTIARVTGQNQQDSGRQLEPECAARRHTGIHADRAAVRLDRELAERQPEPRGMIAVVAMRLHGAELLEDPRPVVRRHA